MVWGCLSRASRADPLAKCQLGIKLIGQGRGVLASAALWSLGGSGVGTWANRVDDLPEAGTKLWKQQSAARWQVANLPLSCLMGLSL